ncbi:MAG: hypothetical protein ACFFAY_11830 [Promethearchaeota archaeon]
MNSKKKELELADRFQPTLIMLASVPLIALVGCLVPIFGFPLIFSICSLVTLVGAVLVRKAFSYPIPRIEEIKVARIEESEIEELEVT